MTEFVSLDGVMEAPGSGDATAEVGELKRELDGELGARAATGWTRS